MCAYVYMLYYVHMYIYTFMYSLKRCPITLLKFETLCISGIISYLSSNSILALYSTGSCDFLASSQVQVLPQ